MGISFCPHKKINKDKWDNCIKLCKNELIYGYSWYLDIMAGKWDALILDDYEAVFPLVNNSKFGIKYLYQPFFTQQLGLFSKNEHVSLDDFLKAIPTNFRYWDIQLNGTFLSNHFKLKPRTTYHLDLNKPYETLQNGYSKDAHKNIRQANADQWELKPTDDLGLLVMDYKHAYATMNTKIQEEDYDAFKKVLEKSKTEGKCNAYVLLNEEGDRMASGVFLQSKRYLHYVLGAPTTVGKKRNATHILIDKVIEEFSGKELILDFEGSEIPSVAYFYKKFSPISYTYYHLKENKLPFYLRWLKQ